MIHRAGDSSLVERREAPRLYRGGLVRMKQIGTEPWNPWNDR